MTTVNQRTLLLLFFCYFSPLKYSMSLTSVILFKELLLHGGIHYIRFVDHRHTHVRLSNF